MDKLRTAILSRLLHWANSRPPVARADFYDLKSRLLREHARFEGHVLQEIRKECWGPPDPHGWHGDHLGCRGATCSRCGGTGVFDIRWVRLEVWRFGKFTFHCPSGDTRVPPAIGTVSIFGRIEHRDYGRLSNEAALWLFLLCGEWRVLWRALKGSHCFTCRLWPLLNLQRVVMKLAMRLRWGRCGYCGKRFLDFWRERRQCRSCQGPRDAGIPF